MTSSRTGSLRHVPAIDDRKRGIASMIVGMVLIAVIDAAAKQVGSHLNSIQVVWGYFFCFVVGLCLAPLVGIVSWGDLLRTDNLGLQLLRAAMLVGSLNSLFASFRFLPLADATAISFASPLFVALLSAPLLGERVDRHLWGAAVAGFVGVAIVVRPGTALFQWAALLPVLGAVFFAVYQIVTRPLARSNAPVTILFYTGVGGLLLTSIAVGFVWQEPSAVDYAIFAAMGPLGLAAHLLIVRAFGLAPASLVAPFNYTRIVWAVLLGYILFDNVPDQMAIVGAALIVASGLYLVIRERRRGPQAS